MPDAPPIQEPDQATAPTAAGVIGANIAKQCVIAGISQAELARRVGLDPGQIYAPLRGRYKEMELGSLLRYASALSVSVDLLLDGAYPHYTPNQLALTKTHEYENRILTLSSQLATLDSRLATVSAVAQALDRVVGMARPEGLPRRESGRGLANQILALVTQGDETEEPPPLDDRSPQDVTKEVLSRVGLPEPRRTQSQADESKSEPKAAVHTKLQARPRRSSGRGRSRK